MLKYISEPTLELDQCDPHNQHQPIKPCVTAITRLHRLVLPLEWEEMWRVAGNLTGC